ncbi:unnamed protein product [Phaedon cochleariae]|uniref:ubiquitinyl hydrolase 1 n=1 Tax=Phaedon cochleariae TaxID=80249 RepID=A0A9N9X2D6_PHACE|nr:unnamed protein product [Phaedon cochleariae]
MVEFPSTIHPLGAHNTLGLGEYFWRIDENGLMPNYPALIRRLWQGLPEDLTHVDAVYERFDGRIVFFIGRKYYVFANNRVENGYPKPLSHLGLPEQVERLDAAMVWGHNGKTYFYSGDIYWKEALFERSFDPSRMFGRSETSDSKVRTSQQDAQEFLCYLLEGLHEDVNMVVDEPNPNPNPVLMEIDKSFSFNVDAMDSWSRFLIMNKSKFVDNFVGQLKSTLRCTFCGYCSETFDPFWELSLPIPQRSGQLSLSHCLDSFTSVEILDGEENQLARYINKFPKILVIHLNRFSQTVEFSEKLNTLVDFPLIGLDMSPYAAEDIVPCPYNLYAISNHSGTTYSGHYTAYCRHLYTKIWHEYNDSLVSSISSNSLVSGDAYILFYQQEAHPKYEQRDVDSVKSTLRTVHYSADNHDMFNTVVEKHETPVYLAPAAHSAPVDIVYSVPVLNVCSGRTYFFKGKGFWKFDDQHMRVEHAEQKLSAPFWMGCSTNYREKSPFTSSSGQKSSATAETAIFILISLCSVILSRSSKPW